MTIRRVERPEVAVKRRPIMRLKPDQKTWAMLLAEPEGFELHFPSREVGTVPCEGSQCLYCPQKTYVRHYAPCIAWVQPLVGEYRGAYTPDHRPMREWIIELTPDNMNSLVGRECVGLCLNLARGKKDLAPLECVISEFQMPMRHQAFSVYPSLAWLWKCDMTIFDEPAAEESPDVPTIPLRRQA